MVVLIPELSWILMCVHTADETDLTDATIVYQPSLVRFQQPGGMVRFMF